MMSTPPIRAPIGMVVRVVGKLALAGTTFTTLTNAYVLHQAYVTIKNQNLEKSLDQKQSFHTSRGSDISSNVHDPFQAVLRIGEHNDRSTTSRPSQKDTTRTLPAQSSLDLDYRRESARDTEVAASLKTPQEPNSARKDPAQRIMDSTLRMTKPSNHTVYGKPAKTFAVDRGIDFFTMPREVRNMTQAKILPLKFPKRTQNGAEDSPSDKKQELAHCVDQWLKNAPSKGSAG